MSSTPPAAPPPAVDAPKADWRRWARARRAAVDWAAVGELVRSHLVAWLATVPPTTVVTYHALADEVPLRALEDAVDRRHRWSLTRLGEGPDLTVHLPDGRLEQHRHGFGQPPADAPLVALDEVGIVFVPGLSFGADGARLGRGGGHYDRLLARLRAGARLVGVTSSALVVPGLPCEPHDVRMTDLATEVGVRAVRQGDEHAAGGR
jgi:5-formyltetrahydrofolate cyclo-ligase